MNKQVISSALCSSGFCKCISHIMELGNLGCCNLFSVQKTLLRRNTAFLFSGGTAWYKLGEQHSGAIKEDTRDSKLWSKKCKCSCSQWNLRKIIRVSIKTPSHRLNDGLWHKAKKSQNTYLFILGEHTRIHQEAKQTTWTESLHRLGPSASSAVQDLMNACFPGS